jgi:hypothetical protein
VIVVGRAVSGRPETRAFVGTGRLLMRIDAMLSFAFFAKSIMSAQTDVKNVWTCGVLDSVTYLSLVVVVFLLYAQLLRQSW